MKVLSVIPAMLLLLGLSACGSDNAEPSDSANPVNEQPADDLAENTVTATFTIVNVPSFTPENATIFMAGSMNSWTPNDPDYQLILQPDGSYSAAITFTDIGTTHEYKFTRGSWESVEKTIDGKERDNRQFTVGTSTDTFETIENWRDFVDETVEHTLTGNVSLIEDFNAPQLSDTRGIWVYLPPNYETSTQSYPVLYMHDGQNVFDDATSFGGEWQVDETLEALFAAEETGGIIVVGINNSANRGCEFTPFNGAMSCDLGVSLAEDYSAFITDTLKPYIDTNYRTLTDRDNTAIAGSSRGGLASMYIGMTNQAVFSKIGAFSPTFHADIINGSMSELIEALVLEHEMRIYADMGDAEVVLTQPAVELIQYMDEVLASLQTIGVPADNIWRVIEPGAQHNERAWSGRFGEAVSWLIDSDAPDVVIDLDRDNDGIDNDIEESYAFLDPDDAADALLDFDADGISNIDELTLGSAPDNEDSDSDGLPDGYEQAHGLNIIVAGDDLLDSDADGVLNIDEFNAGTNPQSTDSDNDGVDDLNDLYPLDPTRSENEVEVNDLLVTFVVDSVPANTPANAVLYVVGTFNEWQPAEADYALVKQADGSYAVAIEFTEVGEEISYKYTRGAWTSVEKSLSGAELDDRVYTSGTGTMVNDTIDRWADADSLEQPSGLVGSVTSIDDFYMPQLDRSRRIWVYLPPDYETTNKQYSVLYMQDGQNLFDSQVASFGTEWQVDETLNQLFANGQSNGLIVIGVENGPERGCEYTPFDNAVTCDAEGRADDYAAFVVETLKPYIDENYRTLPDRDNTAVAGSSRGGLVATYIGVTYQNVFSKVGAFSPTYHPDVIKGSMPDYIESVGKQAEMTVYLDMGDAEFVLGKPANELIQHMDAVRAALLQVGFSESQLPRVIDSGAEHNEAAWSSRFPQAIQLLYQ